MTSINATLSGYNRKRQITEIGFEPILSQSGITYTISLLTIL